MAKQARSLVTREALLRSAGLVFSEQGYAATTLTDIVEAAGVTQGSLYFHFESKHALASELIVRQHANARATMEAVPTDGRGLDTIVLLSATIAGQIADDPIVRGGMRLSTESPRDFPEVASRPYEDWVVACEAVLRRAVVEGDIAAERDVVALARFVMSAFTGVQVVSQALTQWHDLFPRLREMWQILLPTVLVESRHADIPRILAIIPERA